MRARERREGSILLAEGTQSLAQGGAWQEVKLAGRFGPDWGGLDKPYREAQNEP